MKCPYCSFPDSKVIDSRPKDDKIKRRRECIHCGARFTTFEDVEKPLLMVEKRSGSYEAFDRQKLIRGVYSAIGKRPINITVVNEIADYVENYFANALKSVARSKEIGELALDRLREIDPIAYIRFASVYEDFTDINSFIEIINEVERKKKEENNNG